MIHDRRFEMDAVSELATARLRIVAAMVVLAGAGWLAASGPGPIGWAMVAVGTLAAVGWFAAYRRGVRRALARPHHYLALTPTGLLLAEGEVRHHIDWSEVTDVQMDEEKLVVSVARRDAPPLRIQPQYRGVSLDELAEAVRGAWLGAAAGERC